MENDAKNQKIMTKIVQAKNWFMISEELINDEIFIRAASGYCSVEISLSVT